MNEHVDTPSGPFKKNENSREEWNHENAVVERHRRRRPSSGAGWNCCGVCAVHATQACAARARADDSSAAEGERRTS